MGKEVWIGQKGVKWVVGLSIVPRQQIIRMGEKAARAEFFGNYKIFKRTQDATYEALETNPKEKNMLWTIFVVLLILWLLGFIGHFGGALIHLILVVAVVILIINLVSGRRSL